MTRTSPNVSDDVLRRIADAIEEISRNDSLQRTKKQIERLTDLSHPTVARAFAQDLRDETSFALNVRFAGLNPVSKGLSPKQQELRQEKRDLEAARARIIELEAERDTHLQVLFAYFVRSAPEDPSPSVVPINRKVRGAASL